MQRKYAGVVLTRSPWGWTCRHGDFSIEFLLTEAYVGTRRVYEIFVVHRPSPYCRRLIGVGTNLRSSVEYVTRTTDWIKGDEDWLI